MVKYTVTVKSRGGSGMERSLSFSTGEFAKICGVNKRTLHYYDEQGIFSPDHVGENGYRYYSVRQFYPFIMIRMLRQMGLELSEIKEYMEHRSPAGLEKLLSEQEVCLDAEIRKLQYMKEIVRNRRSTLAIARNVRCGEVAIEKWPAANLIYSYPVRDFMLQGKQGEMERVIMEHMRYMLEHELTTGTTFGAMTAKEDFFSGHENIFLRFFTVTTKSLQDVPKELCAVRPAGRYLVTYFSGDYMATKDSYQRLRQYLLLHSDLKAGAFAYEESMLEELGAANEREYVTRIAIPLWSAATKIKMRMNLKQREE